MSIDVIRLLPDSVANQIAAGEVIQRPASVIKELVENAIDAGATEISIILRDAGRTLIQVVDNGCGMTPTDARMAFERHATSKIASADDLYTLCTMGFRGEALPSIAAVAQVELRTMRHDADMGTRLLINESKFESQEPCSMMPGTNMMVKNIFFHMPARRKFLKKDSVEMGHVLREFERLALVNTNVDFTLISDDRTLHRFGPGSLKQRIGSLFGKNLEMQLAYIETETNLVKVEGFVAMPRFAKKRGYQQFLFVNGRNMRHPFFHRAILKCYEQLISPDSQPSYFVNFIVDPSTIDVNIHPQKYEIKFEHEQAIWQILEACVRETLGKNQATGAIDFDDTDAPEIPVYNQKAEVRRTPSHSVYDSYAVQQRNSVPQDWEKLYENFNQRRETAYSEMPAYIEQPAFDEVEATALVPAEKGATIPFAEDDASHSSPSTACMQLHGRYIVTTSQSGLMVIHQHRAHVRILFENYMRQLAEGAINSQILLFPEDVELSPAQNALLTAALNDFETLGFGLHDNGNLCWSVTAVPAPLTAISPLETLVDLLSDISDRGEANIAALHAPLALAMARSAAVAAEQPLSTAEMDSIVADLFRCDEPAHMPDGLPTMTLLSNDELNMRFTR